MKGYLKEYFLKDIAKINVGKDLIENSFSKEKTIKHKYPVYSNTVENKGLYGFYDFEEYPSNSLTIVGRGAGLGTAFPRMEGFGAIGRLLILKPINDRFDVRYLSEYINNKLRIFNESGGIPQLPGDSIGKYRVSLPPLPEQKAIADIFSTWDEAIEKTEKLIKEKEKRFKGLLNSLIKEKDGWKKVKLGDVCEVIVSNVDKKTNDSEISVRLCNYMDVYKNLYIKSDLEFMEATATKDEIRKYSIKKYDVLLTKDSETPDDIAISACVVEELNNIVCGYHLAILRPNLSCYGPFINYLLHTKEMRYFFSSQANGATRFGLSVDSFHKARCSFPPLSEQKSIAETLNTAKDEINILKKLSEQYKKQKQGLMQKLLTGEWRVRNV